MNPASSEWKALVNKAHQFVHATLHPAAAALPSEGPLPSLGGATTWLNGEPLMARDLR